MEKKNLSLKLNVETAERLAELLDAFKEDGKGDRAEAFDMLMPHIEAAFAVDVAPAITDDVQVIRSAAAAITARMDAIARAYAMVDDVARADYRETLAAQAGEIQALKQAASDAEAAHAGEIAELQGRIDALQTDLAAAREDLAAERKKSADADAERRAWVAEREAMTAQMNAITEKLLAG